MLYVHIDEPQTDHAVTPIERAARQVGCADDDDTEKASILPWVLACVGFWVCLGAALL